MSWHGDDWTDPGWPWALALIGLIPLVGPIIVQRRLGSAPTLTTIRRTYLGMVASPVLVVVVLSFIDQPRESATATFESRTGALIVACVGSVCLFLSERFGARVAPLDASQIVGGFRAVFFLRWALADSAALVGFVMFFLVGSRLWVFVVGLVIALLGLLRIAPTKSRIDEWDRRHASAGPRPSLGFLLTQPT